MRLLDRVMHLVDRVGHDALRLEHTPLEALGVHGEQEHDADDQARLEAHQPHLVLVRVAGPGQERRDVLHSRTQ